MILKGNQRANGQELAQHLLNAMDNEHVTLHELRGFLANALADALKESEAISLGTKCQQHLFSLSLNPPQTAKVSVSEFEDSRTPFAAALWEQGFCLARGDRRGFVAVDGQGEIYSLSRWCGVKTKELRNRLGDSADLPDVDPARALLDEDFGPSFQSKREQDDFSGVEQDVFAQKLTELVSRQRKGRRTLDETQDARRIKELTARQSKLPTGLRAAWVRLTGQYQRLCDDVAAQAQACAIDWSVRRLLIASDQNAGPLSAKYPFLMHSAP